MNSHVGNVKTILEIGLDDVYIEILENSFNGSNFYSLVWGDYVANEHCEQFELLSHAMLRLAVLMACRQNSWVDGFATHGEQFEYDANKFIASQVTQ